MHKKNSFDRKVTTTVIVVLAVHLFNNLGISDSREIQVDPNHGPIRLDSNHGSIHPRQTEPETPIANVQEKSMHNVVKNTNNLNASLLTVLTFRHTLSIYCILPALLCRWYYQGIRK